MRRSIQKRIETDYPPEIIENFVSWLVKHGYSYSELFNSSLKTQHYYFTRFLRECTDEERQLSLDL